MNAKTFADSVQKILTPGRSLLLPMLILALGLHAALLAVPIPSREATKEAEDKKNPITVSQIPTEQPPTATATAITAKVDVPPMPAVPTGGETSDVTTPAASEATTSSDSTPIVPTQPSKRSPSSATSATGASGISGTATEPTTPAPEPESTTTVPAATATSATANPFVEFPHWQPSEADCYGLGFGENCRVVDKGAIAQVTDYFKKELAAKDFTANLVTDEPTRKVFKVTKGDKTLFLNIWQGPNQVSYLLSRVVVKQAPADIKTDTGK